MAHSPRSVRSGIPLCVVETACRFEDVPLRQHAQVTSTCTAVYERAGNLNDMAVDGVGASNS